MIAILVVEVAVLVIKTLVFGTVHFFLFRPSVSSGSGPPHSLGF